MPVVLDGGMGEGGGQVVRLSLALSCITGKSVRVDRIRHNRRTPGLGAQHVAAARILRDMCGGALKGDRVRSESIEFRPGKVADTVGAYDVGTAGSIPLILQAAIPVCWAAGRSLDLTVTGGTDVRWAPTADYARYVMAAAFRVMGCDVGIDVQRRGYYPRGGGRMRARVRPSPVRPAVLTEPYGGAVSVRYTYSGNDSSRMRPEEWMEESGLPYTMAARPEDARSGGAAVLAYAVAENHVSGADMLHGTGGGGDFVGRFAFGMGVDENLADMLVVPASVAAGTTTFRVGRMTGHLRTALEVASRMTGCGWQSAPAGEGISVCVEGSDPRIQQGGKQ